MHRFLRHRLVFHPVLNLPQSGAAVTCPAPPDDGATRALACLPLYCDVRRCARVCNPTFMLCSNQCSVAPRPKSSGVPHWRCMATVNAGQAHEDLLVSLARRNEPWVCSPLSLASEICNSLNMESTSAISLYRDQKSAELMKSETEIDNFHVG
jgi:hypothetical protein